MNRRSFINNRDGVAAVEFALMAPALITVMLGIFEFGNYINTTMKLENTARAAAEYLYQGGDEETLEDDVIMNSNLDLTDTTRESVTVETEYVCECSEEREISCDLPCGEDDESDSYRRRYLEVTLNMNYDSLLPYPETLGRTMVLAGFVRIQVE